MVSATHLKLARSAPHFSLFTFHLSLRLYSHHVAGVLHGVVEGGAYGEHSSAIA